MTLLAFTLIAFPPQTDDLAKTWATIEKSIRGRYYARESRKAEMDSLLTKYGAIAPKAKDRTEFSASVNAMIAEFKDSHFGFFTGADQTFYAMDGLSRPQRPTPVAHIGAWFKSTREGYTVSMVLNGAEAEKNDLRKGDIVLTVNGEPFSPVNSLRDKVDTDVRLVIRRGVARLDKTVHVTKQPIMEAFLEASRASSKVLEVNGRKIGYFHLWTQSSEAFKASLAAAVYGSLSATDAMILDLRDGFGGRPEGYADPLFRPEAVLGMDMGPTGRANTLFGYQRPLVVLTNGGSRSAKEVLSQILKSSKRATLIGSRTAGNVLGTYPQPIGDWAFLEIPMVDFAVDGLRLEGVGVKPNIEVEREFDENGKDLYIERALAELRNARKYAGPLAKAGQ